MCVCVCVGLVWIFWSPKSEHVSGSEVIPGSIVLKEKHNYIDPIVLHKSNISCVNSGTGGSL